MWFIIALSGYILLSVVAISDKLIVSNSKVQPVVYTFYSTIFMFGALLALPFVGWGLLVGADWWWALVSGLAFGFGLWTFYLAVEKSEATHITPFNGAMVTIFIYLIASCFLSEKLTDAQAVGLLVLIVASLLLSFEKTKKSSGFHVGFLWAIISGVLFAISHVSAKYLYGAYPFWTAFIWTRATTGLLGALLFCFPAVWEKTRKKENKSKIPARHYVGLIIVLNKVLAVVSIILIQYAMAIGSVTLVGALAGSQYALVFIFVYLLTKFFPKVFKEYFTKRELITQTIAIILVIIGSALFVI